MLLHNESCYMVPLCFYDVLCLCRGSHPLRPVDNPRHSPKIAWRPPLVCHPTGRGYVFGQSPALDAPPTVVPNAVLVALGEARWKEALWIGKMREQPVALVVFPIMFKRMGV